MRNSTKISIERETGVESRTSIKVLKSTQVENGFGIKSGPQLESFDTVRFYVSVVRKNIVLQSHYWRFILLNLSHGELACG
ncbi:hypothetical protein EVAR_14330_1 [Eumeta japonica]|uniref:Uncharacterized protein n=1 Tax=Eumeta variegata TaxID=151549 RepID=A0A4C1UMG1_EUMVA|nr:hypothetical protein EVAR_14330_1 [Eumeta japonica]